MVHDPSSYMSVQRWVGGDFGCSDPPGVSLEYPRSKWITFEQPDDRAVVSTYTKLFIGTVFVMEFVSINVQVLCLAI